MEPVAHPTRKPLINAHRLNNDIVFSSLVALAFGASKSQEFWQSDRNAQNISPSFPVYLENAPFETFLLSILSLILCHLIRIWLCATGPSLQEKSTTVVCPRSHLPVHHHRFIWPHLVGSTILVQSWTANI